MSKSVSYQSAGVDIDAGEQAVRLIKGHARSTHGPQVLNGLGGFGGLFRFDKEQYEHPVLVSSTDGVGTKLKIAALAGVHDTIGQDLVNHCVNDILTTGAQPLFFLDYFAAGKLDVPVFEQVVSGLATACRENGCALIGGETAEMPGFYQPGEYDISGTIIGAVDERRILAGASVARGDLLVGLPSTGLHTNGYSLARKVFLEEYEVESYFDELGCTIGEELLKIHRSYLAATKPLLTRDWLHGLGHITGGGLVGNLKRLLSGGLIPAIDWESWEWLPVFQLIRELGQIEMADMRRTFNLGIGWVFVIHPTGLSELQSDLIAMGEKPIIIGEIS